MFNPQVKRELDLSLLHSLANDYLFKAELVLVVGFVKNIIQTNSCPSPSIRAKASKIYHSLCL